jgi:hypothetical protein
MSPFFVTLVPITDKFEILNRWHRFGCLGLREAGLSLRLPMGLQG